jgi:hypothetical protein
MDQHIHIKFPYISRKKCASEVNRSRGGDVVVIPAGHCWVEGDNQETSVDSRTYGPVPYGLIFAKVTWVIYPFNRLRELKVSCNPQTYSSTTRVIGSEGIPMNYT